MSTNAENKTTVINPPLKFANSLDSASKVLGIIGAAIFTIIMVMDYANVGKVNHWQSIVILFFVLALIAKRTEATELRQIMSGNKPAADGKTNPGAVTAG